MSTHTITVLKNVRVAHLGGIYKKGQTFDVEKKDVTTGLIALVDSATISAAPPFPADALSLAEYQSDLDQDPTYQQLAILPATIADVDGDLDALTITVGGVESDLGLHTSDSGNPHQVVRLVAEHQIKKVASPTETLPLMIAEGSGFVKAFKTRALVAAAAGESMTVDLHKNGVSILTAPIVLDDAVAAGAVVAGTLLAGAPKAFVTDDTFDVVLTYVAGGGPTPMSMISSSMWLECA